MLKRTHRIWDVTGDVLGSIQSDLDKWDVFVKTPQNRSQCIIVSLDNRLRNQTAPNLLNTSGVPGIVWID